LQVGSIGSQRTVLFEAQDRGEDKVGPGATGEDAMAIEVRGLAPLLSVFDMAASIRFYCEGLGFAIAGNDGKAAPNFDWVLLRLNGAELMLNTAYEADERPAAPDPARIAAHEDTVIYFGCPDVNGAYTQLREKGIAAREPRVAPYGMKQLYVTDPDGYLLCFQWRADEKASARQEAGEK